MKKAILYILIILLSYQISIAQSPQLIKDINTSTNIASTSTNNFISKNGWIYFFGEDGSEGIEIWKTDGTTANTFLVADLQPDLGTVNYFQAPSYGPVLLGEEIFFISTVRVANFGFITTYLWKLDKDDNLVLITSSEIIESLTNLDSDLVELIVFKDKVYFNIENREMWSTDGTVAGTKLFFKKSETAISNFKVLNGKLYFVLGKGQLELYESDGTLAGTKYLRTYNTGCNNYNIDLFSTNGKIGAIHDNNPCGYQSEIEVEGFPKIEVNMVFISGRYIYSAFLKEEDLFYFAGERDGTGSDFFLFKLENSTTEPTKIKEVKAGNKLYPLKDDKYLTTGFLGFPLVPQKQLVVTDGTAEGTFHLDEFSYISAQFQSYGDGYIFVGTQNGTTSFWYSDGTPEGTIIITNFDSRLSENSAISSFIINGQTIYFSGNNGRIGAELWKVDLPDTFDFSDLVLKGGSTDFLVIEGDSTDAVFYIGNRGNSTFTDIEIAIEIESGGQLQLGNAFSTTQGDLIDFESQQPTWKIGTLQPGESAELTLNLVINSLDEIPVYAQVQKASGMDQNSSPGNGTCCQPIEDDEAVVVFNSSFNAPDYSSRNVTTNSNQTAIGDSINISYELGNIGIVSQRNPAKVSFFVSNDSHFSGDDLLMSEEFISDIPKDDFKTYTSKIKVPESTAHNSNWIFVYVDSDNEIAEVLETNNIAFVRTKIYNPAESSDLIAKFTEQPSGGFHGEEIKQDVQIINEGLEYVGSTNGSLFLSVDPFFDEDEDLFLTSKTFYQLRIEEPKNETLEFVLDEILPGKYYMIFVVDKDGVIPEMDETNNIAVIKEFVVSANQSGSPFVELSLLYEGINTIFRPNAGEDFELSLRLKNHGTELATNLDIIVPEVNEAPYISAENYDATNGIFNWDTDRRWLIDSLPAGGTAYLNLEYHCQSDSIFNMCAEVIDCDQPSLSSLYNDDGCTQSQTDAVNITVAPRTTSSVFETSENQEEFLMKNAFPNPFSDQLILEIHSNKNETTTLQFFDILGKKIDRQPIFLKSGINQIDVDGMRFPNGLIFIKLKIRLKKHSKIKQNDKPNTSNYLWHFRRNFFDSWRRCYF